MYTLYLPLEDTDDQCRDDTIEHLRTCADLTEEERYLLAPPVNTHLDNDGDIDDGELWDDAEEEDVENDLEDFSMERCSNGQSEQGTVINDGVRSGDGNELGGNQDERQLHWATSIVSFISVIIAIWSYRYNITQTALNALLKILSLFFSILSTLSSSMSSIFSIFPSSVYRLNNFLHIKENDFIKYIVCPKCHSLYTLKQCLEVNGQHRTAKSCSFIAFPEHPHHSRRLPCGERLLSEITLKNGKKKHYPRKYYCYKPICESLALLAKRQGFLKACESWRLRRIPPNSLCDIYDGQIWKDFQYIDNIPFLAIPHNLALMLNIDWFSPFKHSPYSVGAIYIVIANLPRSKRFKKENVVLVGLIPGPSEPPIHINSYLDPLVEELKSLFSDGMLVTSPDFSDPVTIRAALICSACDIPACRKVLGFYGHASKQGCSKCTKEFEYNRALDKIIFGGFSVYPKRTEEEHRQQAFLAMSKKTQSSREKVEKQYGSRFTSLMHLSYFDCVRFHVVDPMHNLFLGTSKFMMKNIWLAQDPPLIEKKFFSTIQERVDNCIIPSLIGRIPHKIASSFSQFTADQWKSWTIIFSLFALHGIIKDDDLNCWHTYVQACHLLITPMISIEAAERGHSLLMDFCTKFEALYGSNRVTPNMHLHTHLVDCIKDYGPVYSFWLFSFERYNGLLGSFRTNQRSVEVQLMRRFLTDMQIHDLQLPAEHVSRDELNFLLPSTSGTLREINSLHDKQYFEIALALKTAHFPVELWTYVDIYKMGGVTSFDLLPEAERDYLGACYRKMYPGVEYRSGISSAVYKYSQFNLSDEVFGSQGSRSKRSSYILAKWCGRGTQIETNNLRPACVQYYFKHSVSVDGSFKSHFFAFVEWFKAHDSRHLLGGPTEIWCHDLFEPLGPASFLPVQRIESKFVAAVDKLSEETVLVVMPLSQKIFL